MKHAALVACIGLGLLLAGPSSASAQATGPSTVTPWVELEVAAIAAHRLNPPRAARALAHVSSAMYLAALAGGRGRDDAVAGAAATVLGHFFPDETAQIDTLADELADRRSAGFWRGSLIGRLLILRAEHDGADAGWTGTAPQGSGFWVPTPPGFADPPLEPLAGTWRTWNLASGSQFRPGPPPAYGSAGFLEEMHEVYTVSAALTDEQKRIADEWADGAGTATPPGHWNLIALDLVRDRAWSTLQSARLFAALNTAQADAFIACWDAKYSYWSIRPVSAIRASIDTDWLSDVATPPFPSYVSGHASTSGAASTVLAAFFPAQARALAAMAEEAALSRLYGGIHYRSDNEAGLVLGRRIGALAARAYLDGRATRAAGPHRKDANLSQSRL
jgi:membrane-associated phospholipid phosphatase